MVRPVSSLFFLSVREFAANSFFNLVLAIGVLVTGCGALATVWLAAGQMQALKRDRPDHFYIHLVHRWCARYGVARARFITHAGRWDLGRSLLHRAPRVKRRA